MLQYVFRFQEFWEWQEKSNSKFENSVHSDFGDQLGNGANFQDFYNLYHTVVLQQFSYHALLDHDKSEIAYPWKRIQ